MDEKAAEGGTTTFTTLAFGGAVAAAVFGMLTASGDVASAINKDSTIGWAALWKTAPGAANASTVSRRAP